jgi:hypothetical protein
MEAGQPNGGGGAKGGNGAIGADPRWLAAGAAGIASAVLALWAARGLPLGLAALWLTSLPLLAAGIGFGAASVFVAVAVASLVVLVLGSSLLLGILLAGFAVPAVALMLAAGEGEAKELGLPLAMLGLIPAAGIVIAAWMLSGTPGGLEGAMRLVAEAGLRRMGLPEGDLRAPSLMDLARVKPAAIGFWLAVMLLANAALAGFLLVRAGVIAAAPSWREARLPAWYAVVPALAAGFWLAADEGADGVQLSLLLVTLVPVFLHGLAALHRATRALRGRAMVLFGAYAALILWAVPVALSVTGFGLYDILSGSRVRRGAPPPRS